MQRVCSFLLVLGGLGYATGCSEDEPPADDTTLPASGAGTGAPVAGAGSGSAGTGGAAGSGLSTAGTGGSAGRGGAAGGAGAGAGGSAGSVAGMGGGGSGGSAQAGSGGAAGGSAGTAGAAGGGSDLERFSFFVASQDGMVRLSKSNNGFGGDLRYGEATGLAGADKICSELAEASMPGAAAKQWRAFLSVANGPGGDPVHAISRIGEGPWYDRRGRLVAMTKADLQQSRPRGADPAIINDLPNEDGVPNHAPDPAEGPVDNHHVLTGSNGMGELYGESATCGDWQSTAANAGRPRIGFSWPIQNRQHWISGQDEGGCGAGINIEDGGGSDPSNPIVGSGGGYGGIYCFALTP
jgi:hypothetical protein